MSTAKAQFNPRRNTATLESKLDTLKVNTDKTSEMLNFKVYNEAYDRYLRDLQSKQRNWFQLKAGLQLTQTSFMNWAAGGDNSFAGRAYINAEHRYNAPTFNVKTIFDAAYGMQSSDGKSRKTDDYFNFSTTPSWRVAKHWEVSASLVLRSQFTNSYKSSEDKTLLSSLFAPAYLTTAAGLKYNNLKKTIEIFMSPASLNVLMVLNKDLADRGVFTEAGRQWEPQFINYFRFNYNEKLLKDKLVFKIKFENFWDYKTVPRIVSENSIDFKFAKMLSASFYIMAIYDDKIQTPDVKDGKNNYFQMTETFGFGIAYNFKTKEHPAPPEAPRKKRNRR